MKIPFNKIHYTGKEMDYIKDSLERHQISGDGYYTGLVSSFLSEKFGYKNVQMTTSATHGLEMAAMLIDLKPGDEVIMPSFTFSSTANSVMMRGAKPIFADIRKDTLNIDAEDIERRITKRTRAIIPVHYAGVGCDMDTIMTIAERSKLYVIEDAAHGLNGRYKGKYLGGIGHIGCFSFHSTKNYVCGEGGAIIINSEDRELVKRSEIIRQKGTDRGSFLRGEVDKYSWAGLGSSYSPSDILMAFLYAQFKEIDRIKNKRKRINDLYYEGLQEFVNSGIISGMTNIPLECESNYHLYYLILDNENNRDKVINELRKRDIHSYTHYEPLHSSRMGISLGCKRDDLPVTNMVSKCLLRLPLYTDMTDEEANYVIDNLHSILKVI